jgi:hypothetical protein
MKPSKTSAEFRSSLEALSKASQNISKIEQNFVRKPQMMPNFVTYLDLFSTLLPGKKKLYLARYYKSSKIRVKNFAKPVKI